MADPEWMGHQPQDPYWADDSRAVYYEAERSGSDLVDLYRLDLSTGQIRRVDEAERGSVDAPEGELSPDRRYWAYTWQGDLWWRDRQNGERRQLTRTREEESSPHFLADGTSIVFAREGQLFVRNFVTGLEAQPADLQMTADPHAPAESDYLEAQQARLFTYLKRKKQQRDDEQARERLRQLQDPTQVQPTWYLGEERELVEQSLSPAGDALLVVVKPKDQDEGRREKMPRFVADSGYVEIEDVRAKVGTGQPAAHQLLWLDLKHHVQHELDFAVLPGILADPLADLRRQAAARRQAEEAAEEAKESADGVPAQKKSASTAKSGTAKSGTAKFGAKTGTADAPDSDAATPLPRPVAVEEIAWSPDGRHAVLQLSSADNKDRWIVLLERGQAATAAGESAPPQLRTVHHLSDPQGWIDWEFSQVGWLRSQPAFYFLSEATGYSQLYLHSLATGATQQLSHCQCVVSDPQLDPEERFIYVMANPVHPGIYETYRVDLKTHEFLAVTQLGGRNPARLSPDGKSLLILHSTTTEPPELYLQEASSGAVARRLTTTVSPAFRALPWTVPEIVAVPSTHQAQPIYSRLYLPSTEPGTALRPAVLFVHGAGYLQNAHHGWSSYFREFMFHTFLTRHGYLVLDMDYRASAGYGRDWRTAIYRQMGTPELEDLADGVAWLVAHQRVDPRRVGVYGGSYGGFLTLMALFQKPDLFACGAALRPVTDWAHYNHPYTSNILNTPEIDPEAYARSSPIEFAAGLTRPLLMCAPMVDDNVFFQDTVRLAQRLIELEKENWEVAIYPVEPHGFRQPSSWLDEYRRIFKLFEQNLKP